MSKGVAASASACVHLCVKLCDVKSTIQSSTTCHPFENLSKPGAGNQKSHGLARIKACFQGCRLDVSGCGTGVPVWFCKLSLTEKKTKMIG